MNNRKIKEIFKYSTSKYFTNKWFILFNILSLICVIVSINYASISSIFNFEKDDIYEILLIDNNNIISSDFSEKIAEYDGYTFGEAEENNYTKDDIPEKLIVLEVSSDEEQGFMTKIISKQGLTEKVMTPITDTLKEIRNSFFEDKYLLSQEQLDILQSDIKTERIMLAVDEENAMFKEMVKLFSAAITYFLAILVFSKIASEIAQEKQSKSSEYILTTVSAKEYLFAKVFSHNFILLIQCLLLFMYYLIAAGILSLTKVSFTDISLGNSMTSSGLSQDLVFYLLALIFYNVLNLILLSIVQATLASRTTSSMEASNSVSILTFLMMVLYISTIIITPYSKVPIIVHILSVLPVLSGFLIPALMVINQASIISVIISIVLLFLLIPIAFNKCAVWFKNGLLDYTKSKKVAEYKDEKEILLNKRKFKKLGQVIGITIVIYIGVQLICSLLLQMVFDAYLPIFNETEKTLLLQMIVQVLSLGLAYLYLKTFINNSKTEEEKKTLFVSKGKMIVVVLTIVYILQILLSLIIYPIVGLDYDVLDVVNLTQTETIFSKLLLIISIALTPAIFEELVFRKGIIDLCEPYGKYFAILFSAMLFGLIHMNLSQCLFAFTIGLLFGCIYVYTKDIKISMFIHFVNNGISALALLLTEKKIYIANEPIEIEAILGLFLLLFFAYGFLCTISFCIKLTKEKKWHKLPIFKNINMSLIKTKYKYILYDYIFDISMILVFIMSLLTENILR